MAVSTFTVITEVDNKYQPAPVSVSSNWFTLLAAGAVDDADNSGNNITRPDQMTDADHYLVTVEGRGTHLLTRLGYSTGNSPTTDPVIQVFGQDQNGVWMQLQTLSGAFTATLSEAATDISDGTLDYTGSDIQAGTTVFDMQGCKKILCCVKTALVGTDNTVAIVQGKII